MLKVALVITLIFSFLSCKESVDVEKEKDNNTVGWSQKSSTDLNKEFVLEEQIGIQSYLKRRTKWDMTATGTGLQYWIYKDSIGETVKVDDRAFVKFQVSLLDGTVAYTSEKDELHNFRVDKSTVESGIQEGIKYLSVGDKAKFIIPSHLGHGLVGDFNKIPPLQVLIVDIELVKVK